MPIEECEIGGECVLLRACELHNMPGAISILKVAYSSAKNYHLHINGINRETGIFIVPNYNLRKTLVVKVVFVRKRGH